MQKQTRWMDVIEAASDEHLGRTLVRLARLAETVHHHAAAVKFRKDQLGIHGRIPVSIDHEGGFRAAEAHKEVGQ